MGKGPLESEGCPCRGTPEFQVTPLNRSNRRYDAQTTFHVDFYLREIHLHGGPSWTNVETELLYYFVDAEVSEC